MSKIQMNAVPSGENIEKVNRISQRIQDSAIKWAPAFRGTIILMISIMAILIRVFSVIRYESVIHEFDPWFNFRATKYLAKEGLYGFWNWFDSESWYPLGRNIGGTIYPGLMSTSAIVYWVANYISIPLDIRNVCVFLAPVFASLTAISGYLLTKEVTGRTESGLFSALFVAIVPSYISRSVAGSYDNEGVSIFALVFTFYMFLRAVNTGSLLWSGLASLAYFYMVSAWGGYAFIINIIPIFVVFQLIVGRMSTRLYVAYSVFYILGTILAMQIPFVGFQAIKSSEHLASHGVFIFLQFYTIVNFLKKFLSRSAVKRLTQVFVYGILAAVISGSIFLAFTGKTKWSGRSMTLLDPTYAKKYIPIIASVSEHQATTWSSFFFDLHFLVILTPVGLYNCYKKPTDGKLFVAIYVVLSVYFASVMVRLLLVLAPAVSIVGGIGASVTIRVLTKSIRNAVIPPKVKYLDNGKPKIKKRLPAEVALICIVFISYLVSVYVFHANLAAGEAYASPSIIMSNKDKWGNKRIVDDYREAYYWLRQNTREDDKIMSWWDYGYQITGMGNRTVLVDNNTWNNSHIATVGMAMASSEEEAFEICEKLDVDYVLVIFGGVAHYSSDDINKFLWMVRIGGGVYPHIKEEDYYGNKGSYRIDTYASETMKNSLMYRLSYYRFDEIVTGQGRKTGWDTVRQVEIGEAFTSEHWIVRIYRVKPRPNRSGISFRSSNLFNFPQTNEEFKQKISFFSDGKFSSKVSELRRRNVAPDDEVMAGN